MKKAIIFDMYETLITQYESAVYFSAQMAEDAGISLAEFQRLWRATEKDRTLGKISFEDTIRNLLEEAGAYSDKTWNTIVHKRIEMKKDCFAHLHPGIIPLLEALKERNIKIGLISNCYSEEAKLIKESVLFPYFDAVSLSYEKHIAKPDVQIYEACLDALKVNPEDCIYIGDGGCNELEAANHVGMKAYQAIWYFKYKGLQVCEIKEDFSQIDNPGKVLSLLE